MKLNRWDLLFAGTAISSGLAARLRRAKDAGSEGGEDITMHEAADMLVGGIEDGVNSVGAGGAVVYRPGESGTNSTAGRIAEAFVAAGSSIQKSMADRTVTLSECVTALKHAMAAAFSRP